MQTSDLKLKCSPYGFLKIQHIRNGKVLSAQILANLLTAVGKALLSSLAIGDGSAAPDYIAVGTGTVAAALGNTVLGTEVTREQAVSTQETTTTTNDTSQFVYTFSFSGTYAITEAGLFNASSGGEMLSRRVFSAVNVVNGDSLKITWGQQF